MDRPRKSANAALAVGALAAVAVVALLSVERQPTDGGIPRRLGQSTRTAERVHLARPGGQRRAGAALARRAVPAPATLGADAAEALREGVVLDRDTEIAIPGVEVFLHETLARSKGRPFDVTDANGRFQLPAGTGHGRFATFSAEGWTRRVAERVALENAERPLVWLTRSSQIVGAVSGAPAGARVVATFDARALFDGPATDALTPALGRLEEQLARDGSFSIDDVPSYVGVSVRLVVETGGTLLAAPEPIHLAPGEVHELSWRTARGASIVGRVLDEDGEPVPDARASLHSPSMPWRAVDVGLRHSPVQQTTSDAAGRFRFDRVPPGEWCVKAESAVTDRPGRGPCVAEPAVVALALNAAEERVDLVLVRSVHVEGVVTDPSGRPNAGYVDVLDDEGRWVGQESTDGEGRFRVGPLVPGRVRLTARPGGRAPKLLAPSAPVEVDAGAEDARLVLRRGASVTVRAVDAATREPTDARFRLTHADDERAGGTSRRPVPQHTFGSLPPGVATVTAYTRDGRAGVVESVPLAPGIDAGEVEVAVAPAGTVRVRFDGAVGTLSARFHRGRACLESASVVPGEELAVPLPAGGVEVRLEQRERRGGALRTIRSERRAVRAAAGDEVLLRFH